LKKLNSSFGFWLHDDFYLKIEKKYAHDTNIVLFTCKSLTCHKFESFQKRLNELALKKMFSIGLIKFQFLEWKKKHPTNNLTYKYKSNSKQKAFFK
jgi:hypothetical protein